MRRPFTCQVATSLAATALIACHDATPPTAAVPPATPQFEETAGIDTTPPVITYTVDGALGQNGYYTSDSVLVTFTVTDPESPIDSTNGYCTPYVARPQRHPFAITCVASSAGGTDYQEVPIEMDNFAPYLIWNPPETPAVSPWYANGSWVNTDVVATWRCEDDYSGPADPRGTQAFVGSWVDYTVAFTAEGRHPNPFICVDRAGNSRDVTVWPTISIDKTPPTLAPTVSPNPVVLKAFATASPNATDALSGIWSQSCDGTETSTIGPKTVTCTAVDSANNTTTRSVVYTVVWPFTGFVGLAPPPGLNSARAGTSVLVKFSLGANYGYAVLAAGSPTSQAISCTTGAVNALNVRPASGSLTYSATTNTYTYDWRTEKSWARTCRQLTVKLADGTERKVNFQFK